MKIPVAGQVLVFLMIFIQVMQADPTIEKPEHSKMINQDKPPEVFDFLPLFDEIKTSYS